MIQDVDESLRKVVLRDALREGEVELSFDAPTKEWSARRNTPTVNLYLYDVREDLDRRAVGYERIREGRRVVGQRPPPRRFALSYLVTAWTKRPEDEHRLLSAVLSCFLRFDALPEEVLEGSLADQPVPVVVTVALPPPDDRSISDLWTALGGDLKPSLDLVVTAPVDTGRAIEPAPPVLEEPRFAPPAAEAAEPPAPRRARRRGREAEPAVERPAAAPAPPAAEEAVAAGAEKQPGRVLRIRTVPPGPKR
jgi:hypothetical protein